MVKMAFDELSPLCMEEQVFCIEFFHLGNVSSLLDHTRVDLCAQVICLMVIIDICRQPMLRVVTRKLYNLG